MTPIRTTMIGFTALTGFAALALPAFAQNTSALATPHVVTAQDNMIKIAREQGFGFVELMAANPGTHPWVPGEGTVIMLPNHHLAPDGPRRGIVVNLADMRLYFFPEDGAPALSYPIGIGRQGWGTPLGHTKVVAKIVDPAWYPPASIRREKPDLPPVVPAGPDNPLGAFALDLGWDAYLIHGTNRPYGVGRRVSHGCLRLYPEDIADLFGRINVGTPVRVVDQPVKLRWIENALWLEIAPDLSQADAIEAGTRPPPVDVPDLNRAIRAVAGDKAAEIDWEQVGIAARERRGVPVAIIR